MIRWEMLSMAWAALVANKFRTLLSMLGIVIGVSTVIAVVGIGTGAQRKIEEQFKNLNVTALMVMPSRGRGAESKLQVEDINFVLANSTFVAEGSGTISGSATISFGSNNESASLQGITPNFFKISNLAVEHGENFTEDDLVKRSKKVILGNAIATTLFEDPALAIGQTVSVASKKLKVVGVLKENGASSFGTSYDDAIYTPFSTAEKSILGSRARVTIVFLGKNVDVLALAQAEIEQLLRENHKIKEGKDSDFQVRDPGSMVASAKESTKTMSFLLTSIATIVLLVSGIGIMNVMFVTVAERTKEIGVLKAIGAQKHDILSQFLLESVILCVFGGIIGVGIGLLVIPLLKEYGAESSLSAILLGFFFSVFVGVFFGFYPALKASKLDPVDALRTE